MARRKDTIYVFCEHLDIARYVLHSFESFENSKDEANG